MQNVSAKQIILKSIPARTANEFVKNVHYSKKIVPNSQIHLGAFLNGQLHGVLQYGPSMDKENVINLVDGTKWNEFLELNRMAFDDYLPKNSESRAIAISIKLIKKNAPHIKWIISFADGTQCGDGTIYRASGFVLTQINKNKTIGFSKKLGRVVAKHGTQRHKQGKVDLLDGYQLRYIYFIDKSYQERLTVPIIPFEKISEIGAGMYKGQKRFKGTTS